MEVLKGVEPSGLAGGVGEAGEDRAVDLKIIAAVNQKGGTGKTTVTMQLAAALSREHRSETSEVTKCPSLGLRQCRSLEVRRHGSHVVPQHPARGEPHARTPKRRMPGSGSAR